MPSAIVSVIATENDILGGVTSVTLADLSFSYGIRNKDTGQVVVPAGQALTNSSPGLWEYTFGREDGEIYECALKIVHAGGTLRVTQDVYAAVPTESDSVSDSESASESASEVEPLVRNVDVVRTRAELVSDPIRGEVWRMVITAQNEVLMPRHIFVHQQRPGDPRVESAGEEEFLHVTTPFDVTIYPLDKDPDQLPGFYRKDAIDIRAASTQILSDFWRDLTADVRGLVANYGRLDRLYPTTEVTLDGSGDLISVPSDPLEVPEDLPVVCQTTADDDRLMLYDELAMATGNLVFLS